MNATEESKQAKGRRCPHGAGAFLLGRVGGREGYQTRALEQKPEGGDRVWRKEHSRRVQRPEVGIVTGMLSQHGGRSREANRARLGLWHHSEWNASRCKTLSRGGT